MYKIQMRSADESDRYDNKPSNRWEVVVSAESELELVENLLQALNNDDIIIDNSWLRLVKPDGKIATF